MAAELGLGARAILEHTPGAVGEVFDLLGLAEGERADIQSSTAVPLAGIRVRLRGEDVVSRAVVTPAMRGCPRCLSADVAVATRHPAHAMVMRGDWRFRHIHLCTAHGHP
jgi:hypothetical protein